MPPKKLEVTALDLALKNLKHSEDRIIHLEDLVANLTQENKELKEVVERYQKEEVETSTNAPNDRPQELNGPKTE